MATSSREDWLQQAAAQLRGVFEQEGYEVPAVRAGVGFPSTGRKSSRIGECWGSSASADGVCEVTIAITRADPVDVLGILAHELCHAAVGVQAQHGPVFKRCALAIGLEGKMRATTVGAALGARLARLAEDLGPYPHAQLNPAMSLRKVQRTRMIKAQCRECEYTVRLSQKWIEVAVPTCPNPECEQQSESMEVEGGE